MPTAISKDGTVITYDLTGTGPAVVLVNGALAHRKYYGEKELAQKLEKHFTVIYYDRRGRGESGDTKPYAVEKEIDDVATLIETAGGKAFLYGVSSGACLALLAASKLGPERVDKLMLYEPPFGPDDEEAKQKYAEEKRKVNELVAAGKVGDAVALFLESRGTPPDEMERMKKSTEWQEMERVGHTLVYDFEVLGDGVVPVNVVERVDTPTLIMDGEKSFDFMHATCDALAEIIPDAQRRTLKGQTHEVSPAVLAPILIEFLKSDEA